MWQAEADTELTLSASPATAVGQSKLSPGESRLEYGSFHCIIKGQNVLRGEKRHLRCG